VAAFHVPHMCPSGVDFGAGWSHTFVMNQNPRTCQCFVNKGPIICL